MNDVTDGIRDYLASGGLFNPELMDHQRVRDLLIESRDEIERLRDENSTFSDSLAAKADRIDRLGETVARQVAEVERLRALVRDIYDRHDLGSALDARMREALGE